MLHRFAASQRTPIGDFRLGSKLTVHPSSAAKVKRTKSVNSVYPVYAAREGAGQIRNKPAALERLRTEAREHTFAVSHLAS